MKTSFVNSSRDLSTAARRVLGLIVVAFALVALPKAQATVTVQTGGSNAASPNPSPSSLGFDFDYILPGQSYSPGDAPPWLSATFLDLGSNKVELTLTAITGGLTATEFVSNMYFNVNPDLDASKLVFSGVQPINTGVATYDVDVPNGKSPNGYTVASFKGLELEFDSPNSANTDEARFTGGEQLIFEITYNGALPAGGQFTALDFNFLTNPTKDGAAFAAIAHIQAIGDDDFSTWVAPGIGTAPGPTNVPEPASFLALGALLAMGLLRRSRR